MSEYQGPLFELFAYETRDFLGQLEQVLMLAEEQPELLPESVNEVFRSMHTIKSSAAMVGLTKMSFLAHRMEDLFQFLRDYRPADIAAGEIAGMLLQCIDYIRETLDTGVEGAPEELAGRIDAHLESLRLGLLSQESACELKITFREDCDVPTLRSLELRTRISDTMHPLSVYPQESNEQVEEAILRREGLTLLFPSADKLEGVIREIKKRPFVADAVCVKYRQPAAEPVAVTEAEARPTVFRERRRDPFRRGEGMVGVEIKKLDQLINLSGEAAIVFSEARHHCDCLDPAGTKEALERMHQLLQEIQETTLSLRMVTLADTFYGLKRSLQEMEKDLDREFVFSMSGEELFMDKEVVHYISSPLLHILRNAAEHGIEPPAERLAAGKMAAGSIRLTAEIYEQTAEIRLEDDGRGIDPDYIMDAAVRKGFLTESQAAALSQEDLYALLLTPGFSTKAEISEYSGRGVGLDVVNENIRKVGGRLKIVSEPSFGSCFILKVPLTLATTDAFVVMASGERYIFPSSSVSEVFPPAAADIRRQGGRDQVLFRDTCYPIYALDGRPKTTADYTNGMIILTDTGNLVYALYVDEIVDRRNVVIKPVPEPHRDVSGLLGSTVMGDGQVSLIIDNVTILERIGKPDAES